MKAAYYDSYLTIFVGQRPLVAGVIIKAAKEEVRQNTQLFKGGLQSEVYVTYVGLESNRVHVNYVIRTKKRQIYSSKIMEKKMSLDYR